MAPTGRTALVTGATGFIGGALVPALRARGLRVVAASRRPRAGPLEGEAVQWRVCDLLDPRTLPAALEGVDVVYYLVHSMGGGRSDFRKLERRAATGLASAAADAGVERIVYLGGPAPRGPPSEHLQSRLQVGEILRGRARTIELRASMVVGPGSASWRIVRDLAMRLPFMVLPTWLRSRTCPVALEDAIAALAAAADVPLEASTWFDLPGPETLTGWQLLERIAAIKGRRIRAVHVPLLTPRLSALWLRLVTRTDYSLARELALGLREDLLPADARYWRLIGRDRLVPFDEAARRALEGEVRGREAWERLARLEERLVGLVAARAP